MKDASTDMAAGLRAMWVGDRFIPQRLFTAFDAVAVRIDAREVFKGVQRRLQLPADWAALVTRCDDEHEFVPSGGLIDGREATEVFFVRTSPLTVTVRLPRLLSADGYPAEAQVHAPCRVVPERGDFVSLKRHFADSERFVTLGHIEGALSPAAFGTVETLLGRQPMDAMLSAAGREELVRAVVEALAPVAFACGLSIDASLDVRVHSEVHERTQRAAEESKRRQRELEAAAPLREAVQQARRQNLEHFAELLDRLRKMSAEASGAPLRELFRAFAEHERANLYEALFHERAVGTATRALVVAAGEEILCFEPPQAAQPARRFRVCGEVGPPRCVHWEPWWGQAGRLLVGASTGVYVVHADESRIESTYAVRPAPSVRGGFNSVAVTQDDVYASHSELGIARWSRNDPTAGAGFMFAARTRGAGAVRAVQTAAGRVYGSVDDRVLCWMPGLSNDDLDAEFSGAAAPITALRVDGEEVFAGTADGRVLRWTAANPVQPQLLHSGRGRPVESLVILQTQDVRRLFLTDTSMAVHAVVLDDVIRWSYEAAGQTLRRAAVAPDLVAALTDLRDRLVLFAADEPDHPAVIHHVARLTGHTIQDACLI